MLIAVGDAFGVALLRGGPVPVGDVAGVHVHVRPAGLFFMLPSQRDRQGLAEQSFPFAADRVSGTSLAVERVAEHLGEAKWPGDRLSPAGQRPGVLIDAAY